MSKSKFDTTDVDKAFHIYKKSPSSYTLEALYNTLDPIITTVTERIAKRFRHNVPDDFLDIQQNVRCDIFRILEKLSYISHTGNQVLSIVVKASVWSFKTNYAKYKRKTPVTSDGISVGRNYSGWEPDNEVPIEVRVESALGCGMSSEEAYDPLDISPLILAKVWKNPSQYDTIYLKRLPDVILTKVLEANRFKDKEGIVKFCVSSFLEGRDPSVALISRRWNDSNSTFWPKYSKVLLKQTILTVLER